MSQRIEGVREYGHNSDVFTAKIDGRTVVEAFPVPGNGTSTQIDLVDLVEWVKKERPEILGLAGTDAAEARRETLDALRFWVRQRYDAEVENRPRENVQRPVLERTWTEVARKLDRMADERPLPHYERMADHEIIGYCQDSGERWAGAFCSTMKKISGAAPPEDLMLGWFCNAIEAACNHRQRTAARLTGGEAVYGVLAALTCRKEPQTFSRAHNAGFAAEFAAAFCQVNDLEAPREGWNANLTHPPEDLTRLKRDPVTERFPAVESTREITAEQRQALTVWADHTGASVVRDGVQFDAYVAVCDIIGRPVSKRDWGAASVGLPSDAPDHKGPVLKPGVPSDAPTRPFKP